VKAPIQNKKQQSLACHHSIRKPEQRLTTPALFKQYRKVLDLATKATVDRFTVSKTPRVTTLCTASPVREVVLV
jgi:hypothetical protein